MLRPQLHERLLDILRRFVRVEDAVLSDHEFILAVHQRYLQAREEYVLDPSE
jgi:hypothetical protein